MARTPASPMPAPAPMQQQVAPPTHQAQQRKVSLLEAIAAASSGFGDLTKDSKNDYLKSSYLGLPGLLRGIKPPLLEQGVVVYSQVIFMASAWAVRTTLAFADGTEEISSDFPIPDPSNQQRIGAVVTYGTRYNLFALLAICPESDDDGNSGSYGASAVPSQGLPGLPGGAWQTAPGVVVQAPVAAYQQQSPQMAQWPMVAHSVQPLPVLQ